MKKKIKYSLMVFFVLGAIYGVWLLVRVFLMDMFTIPTESMLPTLLPGNRIFINKALLGARVYTDFHFSKDGIELKCFRTKGTRTIKCNDIVVFNMPYKDCKIQFVINCVFCKRCVGLPGDSVKIVDGFYKNSNVSELIGVVSEQQLLQKTPDSIIPNGVMRTIPFDDHLPTWTIKNFGPFYVPRKGDVIAMTPQNACLYKILLEYETKKNIEINWNKSIVYMDGEPILTYRFKHDYYFMAGDNVLDSNDSRYWGVVPDEYVVGIVSYVKS